MVSTASSVSSAACSACSSVHKLQSLTDSSSCKYSSGHSDTELVDTVVVVVELVVVVVVGVVVVEVVMVVEVVVELLGNLFSVDDGVDGELCWSCSNLFLIHNLSKYFLMASLLCVCDWY